MKTALLIVDVQHDFLPGGSLAIEGGYDVVEPIIREAAEVDYVVASRDWHPADHSSFAYQGGIWPVHCVADTHGGNLLPVFEEIADHIVDKGTDREVEAYSAFQGTQLADHMRSAGIQNIRICGLATDYCVKATVLDAIETGFDVTLIEDAVAGVDPTDSQKAIEEMRAAGADIQSRPEAITTAAYTERIKENA